MRKISRGALRADGADICVVPRGCAATPLPPQRLKPRPPYRGAAGDRNRAACGGKKSNRRRTAHEHTSSTKSRDTIVSELQSAGYDDSKAEIILKNANATFVAALIFNSLVAMT